MTGIDSGATDPRKRHKPASLAIVHDGALGIHDGALGIHDGALAIHDGALTV